MVGNAEWAEELAERTELKFGDANPKFFTPTEPVALEVLVKNTHSLVVKVFEINTLSVYQETVPSCHPLNRNLNLVP